MRVNGGIFSSRDTKNVVGRLVVGFYFGDFAGSQIFWRTLV